MPNTSRNAEKQLVSASSDVSTREAILNIAETQFAVAGYDGASVRDIQRGASANGGAVFYYFGTKQALFEAVFDRLVEPLITERLRRLDACMAPGTAPRLENVLAAYIEPALKDGFESAQQRWNFARIRVQLLQAHHPFMKDMLTRHFTRLGEAFLSALESILPHLDPRDLHWRYHTMVGALTFAMGGTARLHLGRLGENGPVYDPGNTDEALQQQIVLMAAVFRAPPVIPVRETPRADAAALHGTPDMTIGGPHPS